MAKKKQKKFSVNKKLLIISIFLGMLMLFCTVLFARKENVLGTTSDCTTTGTCPVMSPTPTNTAYCLIKPACPAVTPQPNCNFYTYNCACIYSCTTPQPSPTVVISGCKQPVCAPAPANCQYKPNGKDCSCGDLYCIVGPSLTITPYRSSGRAIYNSMQTTPSSNGTTPTGNHTNGSSAAGNTSAKGNIQSFENPSANNGPELTLAPAIIETPEYQSNSFFSRLFLPMKNFFSKMSKNYFSFLNLLK